MDWKTIGKKLLFPPIWLQAILTVISTVTLVAVFIKGWEKTPLAYVIYLLSAYTLTVICISLAKILPGRYRKAKQRVYSNKYGNRYMSDIVFKTHVSLYVSLGANLLYMGINLLSFFLYKSIWFITLAFYYVILSVMRFLLLRYVNHNEIGQNPIAELKRSRLCAIILMTVNFALSGAVLLMMYQNKGFEYHGILIYVMALYTFYITTYAIINVIKYRKYNSPVMMTTKIITLSAALVSMLSLETAMLSQFGTDMSPQNKRIMVAATGAGVSVLVIAMSTYLIVKSVRELEKVRRGLS